MKLFLLILLFPSLIWAQFSVNYIDAADTGFFDPQEVTPVGKNTGTTLGEQRRIALENAIKIWENHLELNGPVSIRVDFAQLSIFTLAQANFGTFAKGFPEAPDENLVYPGALANHLTGSDTNPEADEILITFNTLNNFYLGLDHTPPTGQDDFQTIAAHEIAHGLGFRADVTETGGFAILDSPTVFSANLHSLIFGKNYSELTDAERQTASRAPGLTVWQGRGTQLGSSSFISGGQTATKVRIIEDGQTTQSFFALPANIGPAIPSAGITGELILVDDGVAPSADACQTPFVNATEIAGKIALIDRGTCTFTSKLEAAHDAGAIAVIIANNVPNGPVGIGGTGAVPDISSVGVDQATGQLLRNLPAGTQVTIGLGSESGTLDGRPYLSTPSTFNGGSSLSHWDSTSSTNLLMEPTNTSIPGQLDLTLTALRDMGWTVKNIPFPNTDYPLWESLNVSGTLGREADSDGDGFSNFAEYVSGSDPENAASIPTAPQLTSDGTLTVVRSNQATDLNFQLKTSSTLNNDFVGFTPNTSQQEIQGEQRIETIPLGPLTGKRFFRDEATEN